MVQLCRREAQAAQQPPNSDIYDFVPSSLDRYRGPGPGATFAAVCADPSFVDQPLGTQPVLALALMTPTRPRPHRRPHARLAFALLLASESFSSWHTDDYGDAGFVMTVLLDAGPWALHASPPCACGLRPQTRVLQQEHVNMPTSHPSPALPCLAVLHSVDDNTPASVQRGFRHR